MTSVRRVFIMMAAVLLLPACAAEDDAASEGAVDGADGMAGMERAEDMAGMMRGAGGSAGTMAGMRAHMEQMRGVTGDSMRSMLARHRQMTANMIARMNGEMRDMNMQGDAAWNATIDSLRNDLMAMPEMDAGELEAMMPGHHRRAMRLMQMHEDMMAGMEM